MYMIKNEEEAPDSSLAMAIAIKKREWPHTTDARIWTQKWIEHIKENPTIPTDENTMLGWFANAIMAGYDGAMLDMVEKND